MTSTVTKASVDLDPIMVQIFRTRIEAIGQEAGAAIENTAISPVITEAKDWSVTICDAVGTLVGGSTAVSNHFGASAHAVCSTIARHGDTIVDGDLFVANDPHTDGGQHPQDVVIQRPVFLDGTLIAWVAISAHMLDMGGMVPGSSCTEATECYQEALRFPSIRLYRAGVEQEDVWNLLRTNIRSFDAIEMDLRSLSIGSFVAAEKLQRLVTEIGLESMQTWARQLDTANGDEFRRRISMLEPGTYSSVGWAEIGEELHRIPVTLTVRDGSLSFDLRDAPPQVPHFVNSKPYIVRTGLAPALLNLFGADLPLTQSIYDSIEILTTPGTIVDCRPPAPIGAAHMDACLAVNSANIHCVQLAIAASPAASIPLAGPPLDAEGTTRWSFVNENGELTLLTYLDGASSGSPAGIDRDGFDAGRDLVGVRNGIMMTDTEMLESYYPVLFSSRKVALGPAGAGQFRSGSGLRAVLEPWGTAVLDGNMTGTRGRYPRTGVAGGHPGERTSFKVLRRDGTVEQLSAQATGVALREGDHFEITAASGGGFGDPLDRDPAAVAKDCAAGRVDEPFAREVYGVVFAEDGQVDGEATARHRATALAERLRLATPPASALPGDVVIDGQLEEPLFPGIVQRGRYVVAERSGAPLAVAPAHWTDGCPVLEQPYQGPGPIPLVLRLYLDPVTGHSLQSELVPEGDERSFSTMPDRWAKQA